MKQLIVISTLLALAACSPSRQSVDGSATFSDSTQTTAGIINGVPVTGSDEISSYTVQMYMFAKSVDKESGKTGISIAECTASILSNNTVLTAAHCAMSNVMFLYFGKDKPEEGKMEDFLMGLPKNPYARRIVNGVISNLWGKSGLTDGKNMGDLSVLKFDGGLPDGFGPAVLMPPDVDLASVKNLTLAGWGQTDGVAQTAATTLLKVDVNIVDVNYSQTEVKVSRGACHGDSGGPAYATVNGHLYLAGVTHGADMATDPKGVCVANGIYTKVQPYLSWIAKAMNTLNQPEKASDSSPAPQVADNK